MKTVVIDGCDEPADSAAILSVFADTFLLDQLQLSDRVGIMERLSARMRLVYRVLQEHNKKEYSNLPELL